MKRRRTFIIAAFMLIAIGAALIVSTQKTSAPTQQQLPAAGNDKPLVEPSFNMRKLSTSDPSSLWVVINKQNPLTPVNYAPKDLVFPNVPLRVPGNESMQLRREAAVALETMFKDAKAAGLDLMLSSGYRSYTYQVNLYGGYVQSQGEAEADTQSARPGYSEHQTGLAVDIEPTSRVCELDACFGDTPEGKWLAANAHKYGYLLRYYDDGQTVTGYIYEPWHFRYVGIELATELKRSGVKTLEEFFSIKGGEKY